MANALVIGGGGREHAIAWKLAQSPQVARVYVAPGNGGTTHNIDLQPDDFDGLIAFARAQDVALTVVGPEVPLANGIVDAFQMAGLAIFGPVRQAAQIEASKAFAKDFMTEQGIPTGEYYTTDDYYEARKFLEEYQQPVVVKASGLAAGKGVIITDTREEAGMAIHQIMEDRAFGTAGEIIVIEERLSGREVSVLAFCDGTTVKPMVMARDYKRALVGDKGLNTGGMGAIAPLNDVSDAWIAEITATALQPVLDGMNALGTPYKGVLYAGLMLTEDGAKVLEYNCRFGDPETQVILPLLKTDLYDVLQACIAGTLDQLTLEWHDKACATVICASPGYPESYPKGLPISGLDDVDDDVIVFHAGTKADHGQIVTDGGRVLAVTAIADDTAQALQHVYANVDRIDFDGMHYRTDIGHVYDE